MVQNGDNTLSHPTMLALAHHNKVHKYHTVHPWIGVFSHTHTHIRTERNTGVVLWLQQFWAMFLKRYYNARRYYVAVITQLIFPLVLLVLALLIVKFPSIIFTDDPRRVLTLRQSSLSDRAEAFFVHFGDATPPVFSFEVSLTRRSTRTVAFYLPLQVCSFVTWCAWLMACLNF